MKEQIIKILESYIIDNIGETSPKIDIDAIPTIADEIQALQLQQTGVSNNEAAVAFVNWLTEKESKYAILYGGTPELEKDYRLATLENDFTIEEVFEHFKKATDY
jgi:hypothetical protein